MQAMNDDGSLRRRARAARLRSTLGSLALMGGLAALAAAGGYLLAGGLGATVALALAIGSSVGGARYADRYVLRSVRARPLGRDEAPGLWREAARLSQRAELPLPRLWVFPSVRPNAFTVGRDPGSASIALSTGLIQGLSPRGVSGVLAHEVAHIRHRDILLQSFAATVTSMLVSARRALGLLVLLTFPLLLMAAPKALLLWAAFAVAPMAAVLLQAALSRQREFAADAEAARLTGDPGGLADALQRIEAAQRSWLSVFLGRATGGYRSPWSSHPPTRERAARLRALAGGAPRPVARPDHRPPPPVVATGPRPIRVIRGHRHIPRRGVFAWRQAG